MRTPRFFAKAVGYVKPAVPWVVFACLAAAMLFDPHKDTLGVAPATFAASALLAGVAFAYGGALREGSPFRDELTFAGETLVSGTGLLLIASILQYASKDVPRYMKALFDALPGSENQPDAPPIGLMIAAVAFMIFLLGLAYFQRGVVILVGVAGHRAKRRPDHDVFFAADKSYQRHLAELDRLEAAHVDACRVPAPSADRTPAEPPGAPQARQNGGNGTL